VFWSRWPKEEKKEPCGEYSFWSGRRTRATTVRPITILCM